ncbi:MAG: phosphoribosylglycinamide formyltransferase, partial [Lachnospiraceae bacterium]|nr:phosphoribosylglycinamide formyltransferase [Lachnospiraceae bacterium]
MLKIIVCVSGGGTNLQAIIDGVERGTIRNTQIGGVISNNAGAYALERARKAGIPAYCISPKDYGNRQEFNDAFLKKVNSLGPDLIV